jgi:hypothetical protein
VLGMDGQPRSSIRDARVQKSPMSKHLHCGQFVHQKTSRAPLKRPPFHGHAGVSTDTIDLKDDHAAAPLLNHITELIDEIAFKYCPPPISPNSGKMYFWEFCCPLEVLSYLPF